MVLADRTSDRRQGDAASAAPRLVSSGGRMTYSSAKAHLPQSRQMDVNPSQASARVLAKPASADPGLQKGITFSRIASCARSFPIPFSRHQSAPLRSRLSMACCSRKTSTAAINPPFGMFGLCDFGISPCIAKRSDKAAAEQRISGFRHVLHGLTAFAVRRRAA
jgi:hypothetical protein